MPVGCDRGSLRVLDRSGKSYLLLIVLCVFVKSYDTDHHSRDVDHPLDNGLIFCNYFEELGVQK